MGGRGAGAGPGRRSHTKSRKGCKTCKARHIRCDETMPHCNNCLKHEVRCDYLDNIPVSPQPSQQGHVPQPSTSTSPMYHGSPPDNADFSWHSIPAAPFDESGSFVSQTMPSPDISSADIQYHRHLDSICDSMSIKGVTDLTMWTSSLPRFLNLASTHPSVRNALLSFSTNHVSWLSKSPEVRQLSYEYGSLALSGLHDAIANFCKENSDAALAASAILVCQANDWRTWSSLETGISSVTAAMESWKHQSVFADLIDASQNHTSEIIVGQADKFMIITDTITALSQLHGSLVAGTLESDWTGRLIEYVQRLQSTETNLNPQQQFDHIYTLRKWTYWVPVQLLEQAKSDTTTLLALIHLYATALHLGQLYPDVGPKFFGSKVAEPLERCLWRIDTMPIEAQSPDLSRMMQWPRQVLANFRVRCNSLAALQVSPIIAPLSDIDLWGDGTTNMGNMSPYFTPLQSHYDSRRVSSTSSLLEVPAHYTTHAHTLPVHSRQSSQSHGFTHNIGQWGAVPSPMFPSSEFFTAMQPQDDSVLSLEATNVDFSSHDFAVGGFVPTEIWT